MAEALLEELAKPEYEKLDAKAKAAALNEWQTEWIPCSLKSLRAMFDQLLLDARVQMAHDKKLIDDGVWVRWITLLKRMEAKLDQFFDFNEPPILFADLIATLETAGVIKAPEPTWLLDLGRRQWTVARAIYNQDVTPEIIAAAEDLQAMADKIAARDAQVEADYQKAKSDLTDARNELNKRDNAGMPIGDKNFVPAWEK